MFYPNLSEGPDYILINDKLLTNDDNYAHPFGTIDYKGTELIVGEVYSTHDSINGFYNQGRIWPKNKVISFWNAISKDILENILYELEHYFNTFGTKLIHINDIKEFIIEIPDSNDSTDPENTFTKYTFDSYPENPKTKLEKIRSPHKPAESKTGWGSKHPKYQEVQKQKRMQPFEGFYPNLDYENI